MSVWAIKQIIIKHVKCGVRQHPETSSLPAGISKVVFSAGTLQLESQEQFRRLQILPCCYKLSALAFIVSAYVHLFTVLFIQETEEETLFKKKQLRNWRLKNRSLLGPHRNTCSVLGFCGLFSLSAGGGGMTWIGLGAPGEVLQDQLVMRWSREPEKIHRTWIRVCKSA